MENDIIVISEHIEIHPGAHGGYAVVRDGAVYGTYPTAQVARTLAEALVETDQPEPDVEVWYALEVSAPDADDWYATSPQTADSEKGARALLANQTLADRQHNTRFDYRIVRKTLTTEVIE
jgi:hypothetical protein